jgi:hypothetical protein
LELKDSAVVTEAAETNTPAVTEAAENTEAQKDAAGAIPWYLQEDSADIPTPVLSEKQKLPEIPEDAPAILHALLEKISVDLGLDDLTLLDLRKMDPPPALGTNLMMILGTARSEKHLHVSADRLCRWLRTNYHLRPDADGLLGRNELKLKLKRKARRAKLVGLSHEDDKDDGVRTGWVCVNVGTVESAENAPEAPPEPGYVGFGRTTEGTKIVVQMLTEEKRIELDLERLWTGIARRQKTGLVVEDAPLGEAAAGETAYTPETADEKAPATSTF